MGSTACRIRVCTAVVIGATMLAPTMARAQDARESTEALFSRVKFHAGVTAPAASAEAATSQRRIADAIRQRAAVLEPDMGDGIGRPKALIQLYAGFVALQAMDVHSTLRGVRLGGRETNPAMAPLVNNKLALVAAKAGSGAATIYIAERLWKRNRRAAIFTMVALNGAYAAIVARNYGKVRVPGA